MSRHDQSRLQHRVVSLFQSCMTRNSSNRQV
jgi:hypothetical protein